jgi:hypothetical protein
MVGLLFSILFMATHMIKYNLIKSKMPTRSIYKIITTICWLFTVTLVLNPQTIAAQEIIFEVHFDSSFVTSENENPVIASGVDFGQGISGSGVAIDSGDILQYLLLYNLNASEGSLSLWVQPNWNPGDILYRILALGKDPRNFALHVDESKQLAFAVNTSQIEGKPIKVAFASAENWSENNWYFLVFTWNSDRVVIYMNGKKVGEESVEFDIPGTNDNAFHLGSLEGEQSFMVSWMKCGL